MLEQIKCKKTLIGKSKMCSGNAYRITLTHNGKKCSFIFNDNYLNESEKADFLNALECDAYAFKNAENFYDFCLEYGYSKHDEKAIKAYKECEKQYNRFNRLFNKNEQKILSSELDTLLN